MATVTGQCICGAVTVEAKPTSEHIGACHCSICRNWTGGPFITLDCGDDCTIHGGDAVGVFKSTAWAERVFCKQCGSSIAWRLQEGGQYHVAAHLFKEVDDYPMNMQVFIDEKPANYSFAEKTETMTGEQLFALFAEPEAE